MSGITVLKTKAVVYDKHTDKTNREKETTRPTKQVRLTQRQGGAEQHIF